MSSNYPPGVTTSMIPGNRPEDARYERALEEFWNEVVPGLEAAYGESLPDGPANALAEHWAEANMDEEDVEFDRDDHCVSCSGTLEAGNYGGIGPDGPLCAGCWSEIPEARSRRNRPRNWTRSGDRLKKRVDTI